MKKILDGVSQGKALTIVREVLAEIKREIEARKEGKISVPLAWAHLLSQA
jgi:hypothetical protein